MSSDQSLIADFLATRSERSFRCLFQAYSPGLYPMALRMVGGKPDAAREILQQTWITAVERLPSFEFRSSFQTWITGILVNHCRQHYRQEARNSSIPESLPAAEPILQPIDRLDLEKALNSLPIGYRQAIELHDIQGYTHKEISQLTDITEGTSKSQLFMARRAVRSFLDDTHHG